MNESTLKFIKCPRCNGIVDLEIYENKKEIIEGCKTIIKVLNTL